MFLGNIENYVDFCNQQGENMTSKLIDMNNYARKEHFDYFRTMQYPYAGVTCDIEVSKLLEYSRANNRSFYLTVLHAVALAADGVPELRQRINGEKIIEYSECPTSHIELKPDKTYCYCTLHHHMSLNEYYAQAEQARIACVSNGIEESGDVDSMYFISTVPWIHYTALVQPVAGGDESNPRITWGKYEESTDGKIFMPVSILAHHALVDGIQIAQFYDNLRKEIEEYA